MNEADVMLSLIDSTPGVVLVWVLVREARRSIGDACDLVRDMLAVARHVSEHGLTVRLRMTQDDEPAE